MVVDFLVLLGLANGTPVLVNRLASTHWSYPIDGDIILADGQRLLGSSKTLRGLFSSILVTALGATCIGLSWKIGVVTGALAMGGDAFSSFCKRRMRLAPGSRATGLDQIPEALVPALACREALSLGALEIVTIVVLFMLSEMLLSVVFFKLHLRERPY